MLFRKAVLIATLSAFAGVNASLDKIAGYEPGSDVIDHNALDNDQAALEGKLKLQTAEGFEAAKKIYEQGGNSKSYALLTLTAPVTMSKGDSIKGPTHGDSSKSTDLAKAYSDYDAATEIKAQYRTVGDCTVGGLGTGVEDIGNCFLHPGGKVTIGDTEYTYSYNALEDNDNGRTIQGFSTGAKAKMEECATGCPHKEYSKFKSYYGTSDYGDKWVTAALDGTTWSANNMSYDFSKYGFVGREQAVKKGTVYLNVYMYVIREFEDAIADCKINCIKCNQDAVHAWDEGVAFYAGSLAGIDGSGQGKLLYALANKRCANFKTCGAAGDMDDGNSMVNMELFKLFSEGKNILAVGEKCADAEPLVRKIEALMAVPQIQGTLRYAYKVGEQGGTEKENAEGVVFAAAVLPRLNACSSADAKIIADEMKIAGEGEYSTDFAKVKAAFERNYDCMGITCAHVGGLLSDDGSYYPGAEPCGVIDDSSSASSYGVTTAFGAMLGLASMM